MAHSFRASSHFIAERFIPVATGGHRSEAAISLWRMPTFITADARTRFEPIVTNESAATASDTLNYSSVYISAALIARLQTPRALIQSSAGRSEIEAAHGVLRIRHTTARLPHPDRGAIKCKYASSLPLRSSYSEGRQLNTPECAWLVRTTPMTKSPRWVKEKNVSSSADVYPRFLPRKTRGLAPPLLRRFRRRNICHRGRARPFPVSLACRFC